MKDIEIKRNAILNTLNSSDFDEDYLSDDVVKIEGISFEYYEDSNLHSDEVTGYLSSKDFHFSREGRKEVSYDSWVGTLWIGEWK